MASKAPDWILNLQKRDEQNAQKETGGSSGGSVQRPAGLGVDIRSNPEKSTFVMRNNSSGSGSQYSPTATYTPGNYSIGSVKGQQQADSMAIGTSWYNTNDGSMWKKENDGSITVYHNGTESRNAHTAGDLGILGQQQMAAGLPWYVVQQTLDARKKKIAENPELAEFLNDANMKAMQDYINSNRFSSDKPVFEDTYQEDIEDQLYKILNRDGFSYDAADDPLYQQYAAAYQREGDRAMQNTLASLAASAGGMNSYAVTAAQQAQNYYGSQLADKIPELYQLAYEMYLNEKEDEVQNLGILQNMSDSQYQRYLDTMDSWYNDRNFAYGMYLDDVANGQWKQQFDYNKTQSDRNFDFNSKYTEKEWNSAEEERAYEKGQDAYNQIVDMISKGLVTSFEALPPDLVAKSNLPEATIREMIANQQNGNFSQASTGNGGGGNGSRGSDYAGDTPAPSPEPDANDQNYRNAQVAVARMGYLGALIDTYNEKDIPRVVSIVSDMYSGDEARRILNKMGISDLQIDNAMRSPWK